MSNQDQQDYAVGVDLADGSNMTKLFVKTTGEAPGGPARRLEVVGILVDDKGDMWLATKEPAELPAGWTFLRAARVTQWKSVIEAELEPPLERLLVNIRLSGPASS